MKEELKERIKILAQWEKGSPGAAGENRGKEGVELALGTAFVTG